MKVIDKITSFATWVTTNLLTYVGIGILVIFLVLKSLESMGLIEKAGGC